MSDPAGRLTRTVIRNLLDDHGLDPSRALGQNFLCEPSLADKIVRLAGIDDGDEVVEIGPGLGSLTLALVDAGARVTAIEIDRFLVPLLEEVLANHGVAGQVDVIHADAQAVDWDHLLGGRRHAVVANLPYNIATPLLLDLLRERRELDRFLVMVQREAGERLAAVPGTRECGIPSVLVAYWGRASIVGKVPSDVFLPRPRVESVLVRIDRATTPNLDVPFEAVEALVRAAFGQRRKMIRRSLAKMLTADQMAAVAVDPEARAESLDLAAWGRLASALLANRGLQR